jgi:hypothetical protein
MNPGKRRSMAKERERYSRERSSRGIGCPYGVVQLPVARYQ